MALTTVDAGLLGTQAQYTGFKNRLINGGMAIDQRNAGASSTPAGSSSGTYTLDRWVYQASATGKFTVQQNAGSVTPPAGFSKYLGLTVASAVTVGSTDYFNVYQVIEANNVADLAWGTASAATVTLSFWVRSSLTGTFGGSLRNGAVNRTYPFNYTISSANTWEQKSITIAGDTSGTWATDNSQGIYIAWSLGVGSTYSGGTVNTWNAGNYQAPSSPQSVVGTSGATFYITGVQLEKGSTATSFDYRPYGTELQLCQRYCWRIDSTSANYTPFGLGRGIGTTTVQVRFAPSVQMRATPSVTISTASGFQVANNSACSATSVGSPNPWGFNVDFTTTSVSSNGAYLIEAANNATSYVIASAEL